MIGASIYGFVDYKKTSHRKEFTKMYNSRDDHDATPVMKNDLSVKQEPATEEKVVDKAKMATPVSVNENKVNHGKRKKLNYKLFSRAPLEERYIDKELKTEEPRKANNKQ
jgi:hypothetical protein